MTTVTFTKNENYPDHVERLITLAGRIRDYHDFQEAAPVAPELPVDTVMYGWQLDMLTSLAPGNFLANMRATAEGVIGHIRGVPTTNPIWVIDPVAPPEPDPVDFYYSVPDNYTRVHTSNPPQQPTPAAMWPWPPWGPLPLEPPPAFWRPVAEEAYTYYFAYRWIIQDIVVNRSFDELRFEYFGYFMMELVKKCYELYRFRRTEAVIKTFFLDQEVILNTVFGIK